METFVQKLAKKRENGQTLTILPVIDANRHEHEADCGCGEAGCSGESESGCCGG
jgi:hypothetical protein